MKQNQIRLVNYDEDITTINNSTLDSGIHLDPVKVTQCRMVNDNRRQKEEVKKETEKKITTEKVCIQHKCTKTFQRYQDCIDNTAISQIKVFKQ